MVSHTKALARLALAGLVLMLGSGVVVGQEFSDNFDSYDDGSGIIGQGGWEGWDLSNADADVSEEQAASEPHSLRLRPDTDVVVVYRGFDSGVWMARSKIYIPGDHTGQTFYILLNTYNHNGPKNWSTQLIFENGQVSSAGGTGFGGGGALPIIFDEWIDLEVEIDLDLNLQIIRYDGQMLDQTPWQVSGINEIQAIDIFSANGSAAYFDDVSFEQLDLGVRPSRTIALTGDCPDPDPIDVTVTQPVPEGADPGEVVVVTETVSGPVDAAEVTPALGGVAENVFPAGLTGGGFITGWLHLGPFQQGGGAAPSEDQIRLDYLTDGVDVFEDDMEPVAGDTVNTDFGGAAASTGLAGSVVNPGGIPTWGAWVDSDNTINYNDYYGGDINNVMMYSVTYIDLANPVDNAQLCVGSDDAIQVLLNGEEVWINSVARGWGAGCQDVAALGTLPAGTHQIVVKIFEGGGGHGFRLGIQDAAGLPVEGMTVCLNPDFNAPCLPSTGVQVTWNITRQQVADGVGYTLDVDKGELSFSGTVADQRTIGDRDLNVCPDPVNPGTGQIREFQWAGLGPFTHTFGCAGPDNLLLGNHISEARIDCEYPSIGEEIEYNPDVAVTTGYTGPTGPKDFPVWRVVDDGNDDGFIDLNVALGNQDDVMAWLVTYVENTSGGPLDLQLCFGSDDNGQVWLDNQLLHNNSVCRGSGGCQDVVPFTMDSGIHAIKMAAWDRGGGWNINLALQRTDGTPVVGGDPDISFLGPDRPAGFVEPECSDCGLDPVVNLVCEFGETPLGGRILELSWTNTGVDLTIPTRILIDGLEVGQVASDAEMATVPGNQLPDGLFTAQVVNCSGIPADCTGLFNTDASGYVISFLGLGPITYLAGGGIACSGNPDNLLLPFIAPEHVGCQYPRNGDEVEVDPNDPSQAGSFNHPSLPKGPNDLPMWVPFNDGSPTNNDQDFEAAYGNPDQFVAYLAFYVENPDNADVTINACFGSDDDGQVWVDSEAVHNMAACRGRGDCQDTFSFTLPPGVHRIIAAAFENGGGSGLRLQLQDENFNPIVDGDPNSPINFLGINRPEGMEITDFPCVSPASQATDLVCEKESNGDVTLSWTPGEGNAEENRISVTVNGLELEDLEFDTPEVTIAAGDIPEGIVKFCVETVGAPGSGPCCAILSGNEVYINCGGLQVEDAEGRVWTEDTLANPSPLLVSDNTNAAAFGACDATLNRDADPILNEEGYPSEIMTSERWRDGLVEYSVSGLDPGTYQVDLGFLEGCCSDGCGTGVAADSCEFVGEDGNPPMRDPATESAGGCRVFDIEINDEVVADQFSQNLEASCLAGTDPGAPSNCIAFVKRFTVDVGGGGGAGDHGAALGQITISIVDQGGGNPPENASIKFIAIKPTTIVVGPRFVRGDTNADGGLNIADPVYELNRLFGGGPAMPCREAGDTNGDGGINIADPVYQLNRLFGGGPPLPPPASCADVPPPLSFPCDSFPPCGV